MSSAFFTVETPDSVASSWDEGCGCLRWCSTSVLPAWLKVRWEAFGTGAELPRRVLWEGNGIIGFARPLVNNGTIPFIGRPDVHHYRNFAISPGREKDFIRTLLNDLRENGMKKLKLGALRLDSTVPAQLVSTTRNPGYEVLYRPEDVSLKLDLPPAWNEQLATLTEKESHEIRRKLRRLWESDNVQQDCAR